MKKTLLVTGASGFIATHTIIEMLNHGYKVRGTVRPLTDKDWSDPNRHNISAYALSKTLSEKAAWDFAKANDLDLTSINPVLVLGPALEKDYGTSLETLVSLMSGKYPLIPKLGFSIVDVRDVASLHRIALESPASIGQRLLS
jgi:dihydroflavonol-4-reductase